MIAIEADSDHESLEDIEYVRSMLENVEWRLDNLYRIKDKYGQNIRFVRNKSQLSLWKDRWYLNLILKDRQRGFFIFIAILILDTCLFSKNKEYGIMDITRCQKEAGQDQIRLRKPPCKPQIPAGPS